MFHRIAILIFSLLIPSVSFSWELVQEETPVLPLTPVTKTIWKQVVEPSGACALAALLCGEVQPVGQRVGVILCGGNISLERFTDLLQQGTVE